MKRAWLYCTAMDDFHLLGEIHDEGSLRDLIRAHCSKWGNSHARDVHILIEGTPEYAAAEAAAANAYHCDLDDVPFPSVESSYRSTAIREALGLDEVDA